MSTVQEQSRFEQLSCCVLLPTYNNQNTLKKVLDGLLEYTQNIIVVNDGATDNTPQILSGYTDRVTILTFEQNKGKGEALKAGFNKGRELGYQYAISIDSDGQHFPEDLPHLLNQIEKHPQTLIIGARNMKSENVPGKSSFGNRFSNFWFEFNTGIKLEDTQSGYRVYPIAAMKNVKCRTSRFEYEIEVIVKSAWKGIPVINVPVQIYYDKIGERISHYRPFKDTVRITLLNTCFALLAVLWYIPVRVVKSLNKKNIKAFIQKHFFNTQEPIRTKAFSIGFGLFMGIFPIWGYQLLIGIPLAHFMRLNKALFVLAANISIPPMIPLIIYLSFKFGALFYQNPESDLFFNDGLDFESIKANLGQYVVGAIALSLVAGVIGFFTTFGYLSVKRKVVG